MHYIFYRTDANGSLVRVIYDKVGAFVYAVPRFVLKGWAIKLSRNPNRF